MSDALAVLEESISDVGYWRWWAESLPSLFVAEFGGVKLWAPPTAAGRPPPGIVGLGFKNPSLVVFLTSDSANELPRNWRVALHDHEIEPFGFFDDMFSLRSSQLLDRIVEGCSLEYIVGSEADLNRASPAFLGFRAGPVGLIVRGEQMAVQPFGDFEDVIQAREAWERYWSEYWSRRDTESPLPKDYACEAIFPLDRFRFPERMKEKPKQ